MTRLKHSQAKHTQINPERDQSLLLLAHGALPLWTRLRVQGHLRHCAGCRNRLLQLTQTSALLADAVRGPSLPAWSRPQAITNAAAAQPVSKWLALAVVAALVLLILTAALFLAKANLSPAPPPAASAGIGGCRPDLPNSRCR